MYFSAQSKLSLRGVKNSSMEGSRHFELFLKNHIFLVKLMLSESVTLMFNSPGVQDACSYYAGFVF